MAPTKTHLGKSKQTKSKISKVAKDKPPTEIKIPIILVNRSTQIVSSLKYNQNILFTKEIQQDVKNKSILQVSEMTGKSIDEFNAELRPSDATNIDEILSIEVSTHLNTNWCFGCDKLEKELKLQKDYNRVIMALQDLNRRDKIEKHDSYPKKIRNQFVSLRKKRSIQAHYLQDMDSESVITYKLTVLCDKLKELSAECKNKIHSRFPPTFVNEVVLYLNIKKLKVDEKRITKELIIDVEEWWNDMLV